MCDISIFTYTLCSGERSSICLSLLIPKIVNATPGAKINVPTNIITINLFPENWGDIRRIRCAPAFRFRATLAITAGLIVLLCLYLSSMHNVCILQLTKKYQFKWWMYPHHQSLKYCKRISILTYINLMEYNINIICAIKMIMPSLIEERPNSLIHHLRHPQELTHYSKMSS